MSSNKTRLTVAINNIIIYEGLSFDTALKPRFKKVLDLEINVSKCYKTPNIKLTSKYILDVIHYQNMVSNLGLIHKESGIFGLLFLGDGATIYRITLSNILGSEKIFQ